MPWYEDWFDSDAYEVVYHQRDLDEAEQLADLIERTVCPAPGAEILDVGTGRGRHARVLARRGYRLTGVDLAPSALETARRRAAREGVDVRFVRADMRALPFRGQFDGVVNLFTSFGFFADGADHQAAVCSMARALRPGGWLVQDFLNAPAVAEGLVPVDERTAVTPEGEVHIRQERHIAGGRIEKTITLERGGEEHVFRESVALLTLPDFERLYAAAGLRIEHAFGDYGGGDLGPGSPRLILTACRPRTP